MDLEDFEGVKFKAKDFLERIKHNHVWENAVKCRGTLHMPQQQKKNFCGEEENQFTITACCGSIPKDWLHRRVEICMRVIE